MKRGICTTGLLLCASVLLAAEPVKQWVHQYGTADDESVAGVAVDGAGNVYVAGKTDVGQSADVPVNNSLFLIKFTPAGVREWVQRFGAGANDRIAGITVDAAGAVFVAGSTTDNFAGFRNRGESDIFVAAFTSAGRQRFLLQLGTPGYDESYGIALDGSGVVVSGYTTGSLDPSAAASGNDVFALKLNAVGSRLWARQVSAPRDWRGHGLACGADGVYITNCNSLVKFDAAGASLWNRALERESAIGESIAAGQDAVYFAGTATDDGEAGATAGGSDIFVVKCAPAGDRLWIRHAGTERDDRLGGIAVDGGGAVYLAGTTEGTFSGAKDAPGEGDAFLLGYDAQGKEFLRWQFGTGMPDEGNAVTADGAGNLYVAGVTEGDLEGAVQFGGKDVFVMKLGFK